MDWQTITAAVVSAIGVSLATARWLTQRLIDHRLAKDLASYEAQIDGYLARDLASYKGTIDERLIAVKGALEEQLAAKKAELDARLTRDKSSLEAVLRREVEEYLGDQSAERQYRLDARKRLYGAIGPLRFQLIVAAAEYANRIANIGAGTQAYSLSVTGYYGRSTAFRLLRLFGIAELIERQVTHADFSVDPATIDLLRFKTTAFRCMSSGSVSLGHPHEDWVNETQHVFHDTLSIIAAAMIVDEVDSQRVMRFDEFSQFVTETEKRKRLDPIPRLLDGLNVHSKPLLWLRFVTLAHVCTAFAAREGAAIGIVPDTLDTSDLLLCTRNKFIKSNVDSYLTMMEQFASPFRA